MKKFITSIRSRITRNTYTATMLIAGQQITQTIIAKDIPTAMNQAEILVDDCGFVLDITAC